LGFKTKEIMVLLGEKQHAECFEFEIQSEKEAFPQFTKPQT
jgi:hypothetical protein